MCQSNWIEVEAHGSEVWGQPWPHTEFTDSLHTWDPRTLSQNKQNLKKAKQQLILKFPQAGTVWEAAVATKSRGLLFKEYSFINTVTPCRGFHQPRYFFLLGNSIWNRHSCGQDQYSPRSWACLRELCTAASFTHSWQSCRALENADDLQGGFSFPPHSALFLGQCSEPSLLREVGQVNYILTPPPSYSSLAMWCSIENSTHWRLHNLELLLFFWRRLLVEALGCRGEDTYLSLGKGNDFTDLIFFRQVSPSTWNSQIWLNKSPYIFRHYIYWLIPKGILNYSI